MQRKTRWVGAWLALLVSTVANADIISSDFSADDGGWIGLTFSSSTVPDFNATPKTAFPVVHSAVGGNPGGFVSFKDPDTLWSYFLAPSQYTGNQSAMLDGSLSFSLQHEIGVGGALFDVGQPHVALQSGTTVLVLDAGDPPALTPDWRAYSALLNETAGWKVGTLTGAAATRQQLQQVLGSLDALYVAAEFVSPVTETTGLDSVTLSSPVPVPPALYGFGAALLWLRRRRKI